jgi:Protein of unknown function (DUF2608)
MKKFIVLLFITTVSFCQIIEIKNIKESEKFLKKDNLVLFDLDNTIMEPLQEFGSDQWFFYRFQKYLDKNMPYQEAIDNANAEWYEIQAITKVKLVENYIKTIIDNLHDNNTLAMGLTTRDHNLSLAALKQLNSLNIDFSKMAPEDKNHYFDNGILFKKGVLFCKGINKGEALRQFLKRINMMPKSIVFIDDKRKSLQQVEKVCKRLKIDFCGLRYGYLDEKVKNFNNNLADIQYENFKKNVANQLILDAKELKKTLLK